MSSAALQSPPHRPTALASSPLSSPGAHPYASSHSSSTAEAQHHYAPQPASSQPSRRQPTYKPAGEPTYFDPATPALNSRTAASSDRQSPASEPNATMPPVAPPRTSSSQQPGGSRRTQQSAERIAGSPRRHGESSRSASRGEINGAGEAAQRSKRNGNTYSADPAVRPNSRDERSAGTSLPIHPHPAASSKPSREASENLIRAISNSEEPQVRDTRQIPVTTHVDAAPSPVVSSGAQDEQRRGGRSRHDHSRSQKATSKFGDFILGNTIGEGEFGKVKLGWKQDSNVQVGSKMNSFCGIYFTDPIHYRWLSSLSSETPWAVTLHDWRRFDEK